MAINVNECQTEDERTVFEFLDLWDKQDIDAMMAYFTEGATYMDIPLPPRVGLQDIRGYIERVFSNFGVRIETLGIASRDNVIYTERVDYLTRNDGAANVALPVVGVFEMANGKIAFWRDYMDVKTAEDGLDITIRPSETSPRIA